MSEVMIDVNDPKQLETLLAEVSGLKEMWSNAHRKHIDRPTRGKYGQAIDELENADLPLIELSRAKFNNDSVTSMQQQFTKAAKKKSLSYDPTVVEFNDNLVLCNFDAEQASEKFDKWIMSKAGISTTQLAEITRDLDAATR